MIHMAMIYECMCALVYTEVQSYTLHTLFVYYMICAFGILLVLSDICTTFVYTLVNYSRKYLLVFWYHHKRTSSIHFNNLIII